MYYDVCIMMDAVFATCDWPAVSIHACIKSGVSGWAKMGQDTTPFKDYSKVTTDFLPSVCRDDITDLLTKLHNGPVTGAAGFRKASGLWLFAYYRNCDHTYVICMHGS